MTTVRQAWAKTLLPSLYELKHGVIGSVNSVNREQRVINIQVRLGDVKF